MPLAVIVVIGLAFYLLGGSTRRESPLSLTSRAIPGPQHGHRTMTRAAPFGFNKSRLPQPRRRDHRAGVPGDPPVEICPATVFGLIP